MEIKQYICKSCGAPIQISENQRRGVCEYCQTPFNIEDTEDERKEEHRRKTEDRQLDIEEERARAERERLKLEREMYKQERKRQRRAKRLGCIIPLVIILLFFGPGIFVFIYGVSTGQLDLNSIYSDESSAQEKVYISKLSDIPKVTLDKLNRDAIKSAGNKYTALYGAWSVEEDWKLTGNYIITYDDGSGNSILSVVECTYYNSKADERVTAYMAFRTTYMILNSDGTTKVEGDYVKSISPSVNLPIYGSGEISSLVHGWFSEEELYLDCIMPIEKAYNLSASDGMYMPADAEKSDVSISSAEESPEETQN